MGARHYSRGTAKGAHFMGLFPFAALTQRKNPWYNKSEAIHHPDSKFFSLGTEGQTRKPIRVFSSAHHTEQRRRPRRSNTRRPAGPKARWASFHVRTQQNLCYFVAFTVVKLNARHARIVFPCEPLRSQQNHGFADRSYMDRCACVGPVSINRTLSHHTPIPKP